MPPESIAVVLEVIRELEQLGVRYAIGGSLASTAHGVIRSTLDADLIVELRPEHAGMLASALGGSFYIDQQAVRRAIESRSSFNVIHLATMFKIDVFIPKSRPIDQAQLDRRVAHVLASDPARSAYFISPEDTILVKLDWYRSGGEVSDRQWSDVLGVLRVQSKTLDLSYLRQMAAASGLADLLDRAMIEVGAS